MKASIGGRTVYGEVVEIGDRVVYFDPLSRAAGWRHARANQLIGHWRKAGRRRGPASDSGDQQPVLQAATQLELRISSGAPGSSPEPEPTE